MASGTSDTKPDIFISRAGADKELAKVIADIIRDAGHAPFYQDEHFEHADFMRRMEEGYERSARMIALLSPEYQQSEYCRAEYNHMLGKDPGNRQERLIVLRVADCQPVGSLQNLAYTDLVPLLTDVQALARVVRVAIGAEERSSETAFWHIYRRAGRQIRHPEIRPVKGFMGREAMLENLAAMLWQGKSDAVAIRSSIETPLALRGLGGVGKTLLAKQYAWTNRERYHGIWWIRADQRETLIDDLVALGQRWIPGLDADEPEEAAVATLDEIAQMHTEAPWLLVYDNVDSQDTVRDLTPAENAHVLITSRLTEWHGEAEPFPVDVFDRDTAIEFLLAGARESREEAGRLADALDRLPLALSHARAYCRARNWPFDRYIESLPELIGEVPTNAPYPKSVFATFSLAIDRAAGECAEAERLMGLLAFFAPDQIPLWLIPESVMPEKARDDALAALNAVSLVEWEDLSDGTPGIAVHRLVQEVMRARLTESGNREAAAEATQLVNAAYDDSGAFEAIARNTHLLPHALAVLPHAPRAGPAAWHTLWVFIRTGEFRLSRGETIAALASCQDSRDLAQHLTEADPDNTFWQRELGASQSFIGDILVQQGDLGGALNAYTGYRDIMERLAEADAGNAGWQRDLSVSHEKIGDVLVAQGHLAQALESYRASMAIVERLAEADPGNAGWQYDLGISNERIGDVLMAQGDLAAALKSYQAKQAIISRLAEADAGNAGWQRDLSVSHNKIGDVLVGQSNLTQALENYRASHAICERLAEADAGNAGWQRDLSVSHNKIGDVLVAQGHLTQALENYRASHMIFERLAEADAENAGWQRDLSVSHEKIGDVLRAQGHLAPALESYRASLAIAERLAEADAGNAGWQRDLSVSHIKIGDVLRAQGHLAPALESYRASLAIAERLAEADAGNAGWQYDVAASLQRTGLVAAENGEKEEALAEYRRGLGIMKRLVELAPDHAAFRRDHDWFEARIAELGE